MSIFLSDRLGGCPDFPISHLTVDPKDRRMVVSKRIKEEFENGKDY